MKKSKNVSFVIQKYLLDQIRVRASVRNATYNEEMRSLIKFALANGISDDAPHIAKGELVRTVVWLNLDDEQIIRGLAEERQRSMTQQIVRLFAYALEEIARRDLELISSMIERHNRQPQAG
jgi:hypothetical protein